MQSLDQTTILLILGSLFLIGLAADLIGRHTMLPRVTLLLLGGLALGPAGGDVLPERFLELWFPALTNIALALIGFLLGQQLSVAMLKQRGQRVIVISLCKVFGAALTVFLVLAALGISPVVALLLAGIAPATAPAATYDVVHESHATGEFPALLLSVVALDDVWGLLLFTIILALVGALPGMYGEAPSVLAGIGGGAVEILGSVALGWGLGLPMAFLTGRLQYGEPMLVEAMAFVFVAAGLAAWFEFSPILTAMAMGSAVATLATHHSRPFHAIEGVEWPFMILFFVLAGASLEISAIGALGGAVGLYILCRCVGIYLGTRIGGHIAKVDAATERWLGIALFPQAGVAIGMALLVSQRYPELGDIILPIVLTSTIIFELVAPVTTRYALRVVRRGEAIGGAQKVTARVLFIAGSWTS